MAPAVATAAAAALGCGAVERDEAVPKTRSGLPLRLGSGGSGSFTTEVPMVAGRALSSPSGPSQEWIWSSAGRAAAGSVGTGLGAVGWVAAPGRAAADGGVLCGPNRGPAGRVPVGVSARPAAAGAAWAVAAAGDVGATDAEPVAGGGTEPVDGRVAWFVPW